jgi:CubicO group peptidase (beta-lactamase class C family)
MARPWTSARLHSAEAAEKGRSQRVAPERGFFDECVKGDMYFSLGFAKPGPTAPFGNPGSFGHPGAGGSFGFADPQVGIGYAYVTNRMGTTLPFDPRDVALRTALASISI